MNTVYKHTVSGPYYVNIQPQNAEQNYNIAAETTSTHNGSQWQTVTSTTWTSDSTMAVPNTPNTTLYYPPSTNTYLPGDSTWLPVPAPNINPNITPYNPNDIWPQQPQPYVPINPNEWQGWPLNPIQPVQPIQPNPPWDISVFFPNCKQTILSYIDALKEHIKDGKKHHFTMEFNQITCSCGWSIPIGSMMVAVYDEKEEKKFRSLIDEVNSEVVIMRKKMLDKEEKDQERIKEENKKTSMDYLIIED